MRALAWRVSKRLARHRTPVLLMLAALLTAASCDWVEDRFKTCRDLRVDLVNNRQARLAVHIADEAEGFSDVTYLESGAARRIVVCIFVQE